MIFRCFCKKKGGWRISYQIYLAGYPSFEDSFSCVIRPVQCLIVGDSYPIHRLSLVKIIHILGCDRESCGELPHSSAFTLYLYLCGGISEHLEV